MNESIQWLANPMRSANTADVSSHLMNRSEVREARRFHAAIPGYQETPLRRLSHLADLLGVGGIYVKDESQRFALNAFKALGASYAMAKYLSSLVNSSSLSYAYLTSEVVKSRLGDITFVTATDGNHGRGVAWTARMLGQKAVVYLPKGASVRRLEAIRAEGAEAYITDLNYDDAVRLAADKAKQLGWVVIQDTAWPGYETIPAWIMQGYGTMAAEAFDQLNRVGIDRPSHIFVQAGVGSLAGAIQGYVADVFSDCMPTFAVVEANQADCLLRSVQAADGKMRTVGGDLATVMAGLACGEPNPLGWDILRCYAHLFVACPDWVAALGMRILGNPLANDPRVVSGESGAVTLGLLHCILQDPRLQAMRQVLGLDQNSQVLLFSTEGDTDPDRYRSIVWQGEYPAL